MTHVELIAGPTPLPSPDFKPDTAPITKFAKVLEEKRAKDAQPSHIPNPNRLPIIDIPDRGIRRKIFLIRRYRRSQRFMKEKAEEARR